MFASLTITLMSRLPRVASCAFAALFLAGCSSSPAEPAATAAAEPPPEETVALEVAVTDVVPIDFTLHSEEGKCWVHLAEDTPAPDLIVEDADGTVVATQPIRTTGTWDEVCTITTVVSNVPASGFYTIRLEGTVNRRAPEDIAFDTTVAADPIDGKVSVEWQL